MVDLPEITTFEIGLVCCIALPFTLLGLKMVADWLDNVVYMLMNASAWIPGDEEE